MMNFFKVLALLTITTCVCVALYWYSVDNIIMRQPAKVSMTRVLEGQGETFAQHESSRGAAGLSQAPAPACSALFTITQVPRHKMLQHYISNLRRWFNRATDQDDGRHLTPAVADTTSVPHLTKSEHVVTATPAGEEAQAAVTGVREVLQGRQSSAGVSSRHYRKLGRLLPKLITFTKYLNNSNNNSSNNYSNNNNNSQAQIKARAEERNISRTGEDNMDDKVWALLAGESRVGVSKGVLPYVPCLIAPYSDPGTFAACVSKRLAKKPSLWIHFLGDSKMRHVFGRFLDRTDGQLHYIINYDVSHFFVDY